MQDIMVSNERSVSMELIMSSLETYTGSQNSLYIVHLLTPQPDSPLNLLVSPKWSQLKKKEKERRQESK